MEIAKQLFMIMGRLFEIFQTCRLPKKRSVKIAVVDFHTGLSERT